MSLDVRFADHIKVFYSSCLVQNLERKHDRNLELRFHWIIPNVFHKIRIVGINFIIQIKPIQLSKTLIFCCKLNNWKPLFIPILYSNTPILHHDFGNHLKTTAFMELKCERSRLRLNKATLKDFNFVSKVHVTYIVNERIQSCNNIVDE